MKKLLVLFAVLFTTPICAQITLEHTYPASYGHLYLFQVDSAEWNYTYYNNYDTIVVYNLDHSLNKVIVIPVPVEYFRLHYFSKKLFALDDAYEFLLVGYINNNTSLPFTRVFNESGSLIFSCDTCYPNQYTEQNSSKDQFYSIYNTGNGTKMVMSYGLFGKKEVYSLPGKLPTCNTKLSVTDAPTIISGSSPSISAYPNPSNGKIRVAYTLPEGVTTGELVITTTDGREVKRYRVGNMFNDILIEKSELASGAYFYKLTSERGESEARKFVITN